MAEIKEFAEEIEPKDRRCLFCRAEPPEHLKGKDMRGKKGHWYSNALLNMRTRQVVRFYLCPQHLNRIAEASQWVRDGFIEEEVAELRGINAVRAWLKHHPELRKYAEQ